jgi:hypothetical protein
MAIKGVQRSFILSEFNQPVYSLGRTCAVRITWPNRIFVHVNYNCNFGSTLWIDRISVQIRLIKQDLKMVQKDSYLYEFGWINAGRPSSVNLDGLRDVKCST